MGCLLHAALGRVAWQHVLDVRTCATGHKQISCSRVPDYAGSKESISNSSAEKTVSYQKRSSPSLWQDDRVVVMFLEAPTGVAPLFKQPFQVQTLLCKCHVPHCCTFCDDMTAAEEALNKVAGNDLPSESCS